MRYMDKNGDSRVTWDPAIAAEVDLARHTFDTLRAKGYMAYTEGARGVGGVRQQIHAFDPAAGTIILAPALAGG
jgi:hypothetical protein